jgi:enediyne biosynthesis protein E4
MDLLFDRALLYSMHVIRLGWSCGVAVGMVAVMSAQRPSPEPSHPRFQNVASEAGLRFVHHVGDSSRKFYVDSVPAGLAVLDYNGDGRPDIFFTDSAEMPSLEKPTPAYANRLFRNDGRLRFTDVTEAAGVAGVGYAMGAAAGDYDNDGRVDLFVSGVRRNQLLHNRGDGRFEDVTARSGISSDEWSVAAGWFDYDNDGELDLFVVNYVQWSLEADRACADEARAIPIFCHPRSFHAVPNRLYRNRGDGRFEDVSVRAGIAAHPGKGMSVAFADFDHDGRLDIFVTNDTVPNFLFRNNGDGTFTEIATIAGVSVPDTGRPVSGMGADFQDLDNDGWEDIFMTALAGETFPLFRNDRRGGFAEATQSSGLAALTVKRSGWCALAADVDNDGWKDIFTANSHVNDRIGDFESIAWKQSNSLFMSDGRGRFRDATVGSALDAGIAVHRGCGAADFDGDGRLDFVVLSLGSPVELWINDTTTGNRWLVVRLAGTRSNRDGIGARVIVGNQVRTMTTAEGYASSSHAGAHFGLGSAERVRVEIHWPSGTRQVIENVKANQVVSIREPS